MPTTIYGNHAEKLDVPQTHYGIMCEYYDVDMGEPIPAELVERERPRHDTPDNVACRGDYCSCGGGGE